MSEVIYINNCTEAKYYPDSKRVILTFPSYNNNGLIRKIIECTDLDHKEYLLSLKGKPVQIGVKNYLNDPRVTSINTKIGNTWINIFSKNNKFATIEQVKTFKTIPEKLLDIENIIFDKNDNVKLSGFLYKNLSQFELIDNFLSDYNSYIRIFCSKYGFISRENALKNREYIIDIPFTDKMKEISKKRCAAKCKRFEVDSPQEEEKILRNEVQGVIGEETQVKFFNTLWEFLSINKKIHINDNIYDSMGDTGTDFMVGSFNVDVKQRNRPPNADLLLNKKTIDPNTLMLLVTCLTNHNDEYYNDFCPYLEYTDGRQEVVHQSVLTGYTDSDNFNFHATSWKNMNNKWVLAYYELLPVDNFIKLMIIEALKEEIVK